MMTKNGKKFGGLVERCYICKQKIKVSIFMEATMFNPIQLQLLQMFERNTSVEELHEVQDVMKNYYAQKLDRHMEELWDSGILDQKRLDEISKMDLHEWMRSK